MAKKINKWEPDDFELEMTTHWSFPKRGDWATHDAKWRGNWSPYIPRNIILRYSKEGDLVLDQFAGGGTTLVEAKLLNPFISPFRFGGRGQVHLIFHGAHEADREKVHRW